MAETPVEKETRPFADFLNDHNRGAEHRKAGEALQRLAGAVAATGKKGSVTVKVDVEPMKGTEGTMVTTVTVTEKLPVEPAKSAVFYTDANDNLIRTDPRQLAFEGLKDVSAPQIRDTPAAPAVGGER